MALFDVEKYLLRVKKACFEAIIVQIQRDGLVQPYTRLKKHLENFTIFSVCLNPQFSDLIRTNISIVTIQMFW